MGRRRKRKGTRANGPGTGAWPSQGRAAPPAFRWRFSPADGVSLANMAMGVLAVFFSLAPGELLPGGADRVTMASSLIIAALVLDGLDGAVARLLGSSPLGLRMDSAADFVSFCLAPGALAWAAYRDHGLPPLTGSNGLCLLVAALFAAAGLKRLVDFTRSGYRKHRFTGLATPAAAFTCAVMVHVLPAGSDVIAGPSDPHLQLSVLGITALLMVAPLEYPKVRGLPGAAMAVSFTLALLYLGLRKTVFPMDDDALFAQYNVLRFMALGLILMYVVGGALYAMLVEEKKPGRS